MARRVWSTLAALIGAAALVAGAPASAQSDEREAPPAFAIPGSAVHVLPTAANGVDYELYMRASDACTAETPCTAVYMLDAEYSFGLASLIAEHLEARGQLAPLVLVAIAYQDKSQYRLNRTRDYTPLHWPEGGYGEEAQTVSGGGPAFLDVLANEIIPFVEANAPASSAHRGLIGHSYGGLFATYALLEERELFDRALIVSPSYWYADGWIFAREAETHERALGRESWAYLAVGSWEEQPENGRAMVSDLERMGDILQARDDANLALEVRVFEDETHASIFPAALSTGLRRLFSPD